MNIKTKQGLAIGLSIMGAAGTILTSYLVRETAKKEVDTYETLLPFKKGNYIDIVKMYKLPLAVGGATIASIIGSTVMSRRAEASLLSMAVMADQGWRKYKHQVKKTLGLDKHHEVVKGMAKDGFKKEMLDVNKDRRHLYYEELIGWFQANPEDVIDAYASINEILNMHRGTGPNGQFEGVTLADFLRMCKANVINSQFKEEILDTYGWNMDYLEEAYNEIWVHMGLSDELTDDGEMPYKVISWVQDPIHLDTYDDNMDQLYAHEEARSINFSDYYEDATESIKKMK